MCAIEAAKRGRRVAIVEHAERPGKKLLISGGGRCNFTNIYSQAEHFLSANPHFAKSALARYTPADFIALVEKHRIPYHEKAQGQLFCDRSANDILNMLEGECRDAGVEIFLKCNIREVWHESQHKVGDSSDFAVHTDSIEFRAPALVVATGGLSIPKIGATAFGYQVARQFGLRIVETRPALVPLLLSKADCARYCDLAGISTEANVATGTQSFRDQMLITHRGLSGPAILQASSYWTHGQPVVVDLAPGRDVTAAVRAGNAPRNVTALRSAFQGILPHRFASRWLDLHQPGAWTNQALEEFERQIHGWALVPAGTEGFEKAEVTAGGVDTDELSSQTMESRKIRGLFFVGEVVDVTGHLGGHNFQWAWASGAAAGRAL